VEICTASGKKAETPAPFLATLAFAFVSRSLYG